MDVEACKVALNSLATLLQGPAFQQWRQEFVQKYIHVFDYGEENKLEYTTVHNEYVAGLEQLLSSALPAGMSMRDLEQALQSQPHLFQDLDEDAATTAAVKLLLEAGDFQAFRDMMQYERQRAEDADTPAQLLQQMEANAVPQIEVSDAVLQRCHELAGLASAPGWANILTSDWLVIDKMPVPDAERASAGEIYLRGAWTMNLSVVECCDMMFNFSERRRGWDKNFVSVTLEKGQSLQDDDIVVSSEIDYGFLLHLAGLPRKLTSRLYTRWDYPTPGSVTGTMIPWKMPEDAFDHHNPVLSLKVTSIGPHSTDPNTCVMTTIESNKLGKLPRWVLSMLMSVTAPQLMKGLEGRYISAVRHTGTMQDSTKFAGN